MQELLYTSAPRGLKPGSRGFCTVLSTQSMVAPLANTLEGLSGYRPVFAIGDKRVADNPVNYSHLKLNVVGKSLSVLSRVADYGLDYSQRTNKLAHHLVLDVNELPAAGPASVARLPGMLRQEWDGEPKIVPPKPLRKEPTAPIGVCQHWKDMTGDAGWAGVLAESFLSNPTRPVILLFEPGQDLLPLIDEAISLLAPERRWDVTFSTYFTALPQGLSCLWRCIVAGSKEANESIRFASALRIDLTKTTQTRAAGGELVGAARSGVYPEYQRSMPTGRPQQRGEIAQKSESIPIEFAEAEPADEPLTEANSSQQSLMPQSPNVSAGSRPPVLTPSAYKFAKSSARSMSHDKATETKPKSRFIRLLGVGVVFLLLGFAAWDFKGRFNKSPDANNQIATSDVSTVGAVAIEAPARNQNDKDLDSNDHSVSAAKKDEGTTEADPAKMESKDSGGDAKETEPLITSDKKEPVVVAGKSADKAMPVNSAPETAKPTSPDPSDQPTSEGDAKKRLVASNKQHLMQIFNSSVGSGKLVDTLEVDTEIDAKQLGSATLKLLKPTELKGLNVSKSASSNVLHLEVTGLPGSGNTPLATFKIIPKNNSLHLQFNKSSNQDASLLGLCLVRINVQKDKVVDFRFIEVDKQRIQSSASPFTFYSKYMNDANKLELKIECDKITLTPAETGPLSVSAFKYDKKSNKLTSPFNKESLDSLQLDSKSHVFVNKVESSPNWTIGVVATKRDFKSECAALVNEAKRFNSKAKYLSLCSDLDIVKNDKNATESQKKQIESIQSRYAGVEDDIAKSKTSSEALSKAAVVATFSIVVVDGLGEESRVPLVVASNAQNNDAADSEGK